jgi:hypothetical protein
LPTFAVLDNEPFAEVSFERRAAVLFGRDTMGISPPLIWRIVHSVEWAIRMSCISPKAFEKIDFRNTIIIMTSNVGAELIKRQTAMGFGAIAGPDVPV